MKYLISFLAVCLVPQAFAMAEIVSSSPTHFVLHHEVTTSQYSPDALWQRLIEPAVWWHPDHTYSGDAANLSLDPQAGGLWKEEWDGGFVSHGRVLFAVPAKSLRLEAPFGPLQGAGAYVTWTITITPGNDGTIVTFDETAIAPPTSDMVELAKAVDFVKTEAINRLTAK